MIKFNVIKDERWGWGGGIWINLWVWGFVLIVMWFLCIDDVNKVESIWM